MSQGKDEPIFVTAIPVTNTYNEAQAPQAYPTVTVEAAREAICRGCGRPFIRAPGVHEAQAQYFRCDECNSISNVVIGSCVIL
jgi:hypothetical protein